MAVTLSEQAAKKVKELVDEYGYGGLRVGIKGGGCAGFEYVVSMAQNEAVGDHVTDSFGAKVFCDKKSYLFINGTEVDYKEDLMGSGFSFRNPLSKGDCGCHKSFSI